ncbi:hypothetical protein [Elioraea thermophila]|uniref:hypothetical protein n=1 Tax=Elioraea thermophila TaxID=2185104 RepID=UPI000DF22DD1|nr:hypothetical protein [Elioraea thermophila]
MLQRVCESDVGLAGAWIGEGVALLLWNAALWPAPLRPPAGPAAIGHPIVSAVLPPGDRRVALLRLRPSRRGERIALGEGGPGIAPAALGDDAGALVETLEPLARRRLLGLLLEAGLGLFRLQDSSTFRALLATLARDLARGEPPARPVAAGPGPWRFLRANGPAPAGVVPLVGEARIVGWSFRPTRSCMPSSRLRCRLRCSAKRGPGADRGRSPRRKAICRHCSTAS